MRRSDYPHIVGYTSLPSSRENIAQLDRFPWRWMISPFRPYKAKSWGRDPGCFSPIPARGFALDNGAWSYHRTERPFDPEPFLEDVRAHGIYADFVVIPDRVMDPSETFRMADEWIPRLRDMGISRLMFVTQPGMQVSDLERFCRDGIGIFVGGGDHDYRMPLIRPISELCESHGVLCHVGRVHSSMRVHACMARGAHSYDGSGMAIWVREAERMTCMMRQLRDDMFPRRGSYAGIRDRYLQNWENGVCTDLQIHDLAGMRSRIVELYEEMVFPQLGENDYRHITRWRQK